MPRKKLDLVSAALIGLVFFAFMPWSRMLTARNDFVHFYIGGLYYGHPEIFSPEANYAKQRELIGATLEHSFFGRPAFYGFFLKPLTWLGYMPAYWLFQFGSLIALAVFLKLNLRRYDNLLPLCLMSPALAANFVNGQDVMYLLLFCSVSLVCIEKDWDLLAGLALAACAIKPHLFVLTPLAAVFFKRWRVLLGGAIGGALLIALSLGSGGWKSQLELVQQLGNPEHSPYPDLMPSLRSLTGDHNELFLVLALATITVTAWLMRRSRSYEAAFGWALIGGLLAAYHAYIQDCLLLILALTLVHQEMSKPARALLVAAVLPFAYIPLAAGCPYSGVFPALLLASIAAQLAHSLRLRSAVPALVNA